MPAHAARVAESERGSNSVGESECVGQDLNLRTPAGQRPQRCAFDQAGPPTHGALSSRASILIFLQRDFASVSARSPARSRKGLFGAEPVGEKGDSHAVAT